MKHKYFLKTLFSFFIILNSFSQNVTITTIVDGTVATDTCSGATGSDPRFVELYVSGTVNFSNYDLDVETNGPNSSGAT